MIRNYIYGILCAAAIVSSVKCMAMQPSAPPVVYTFYNAMKSMSTDISEAAAYELQQKMQHCFLYGKADAQHNVNSGIEIPNDFYDLGYGSRKKISSTLYTHVFKMNACAKEKKLQVGDIKIKGSTYVHEVDLKRFTAENSSYIQTLVTRTFKINGADVIFNDTILTQNNMIYSFRNGVGVDNDENIETLRALAAQYNLMKQYKKAYQTYERILNIEPENANAYYRLGILAFWYGKKCGFYSKYTSQNKGKEYMRRALYLRANHADLVLYYMEHPAAI